MFTRETQRESSKYQTGSPREPCRHELLCIGLESPEPGSNVRLFPGILVLCSSIPSIDQFFENFTSFQLFRQAEFLPMLQQIETANQCTALLATILIFATRECNQYNDGVMRNIQHETTSSSYETSRALKYVDGAISECEDAPVPLPLLQALILVSHWLLIQGVRGRAWRYLGLTVRISYELNMHLVDADKSHDDEPKPEQWCEDEKRRRAWWAIWEMDVFASVIRRCPTAISWSQNQTFLPVEDDKWCRGEPQKSTFLRLDVVERYKALEASGNHSPKAWFIVINSLMKEAQGITSPVGLGKAPGVAGEHSTRTSMQTNGIGHDARRKFPANTESLNRLRTVQNALQCTIMALSSALRYRNQYLSFGSKEFNRQNAASLRLRHSSIYSIHMMVQLTKLMIYKYHIFRTGMEALSPKPQSHNVSKDACQWADIQALDQYSEASDEIVLLVGRSDEDHHRHVNPFLANTIWLAGAVQLLYRELASLDASDKALTNSKLELLSMTYKRFVAYWDMSGTLNKNLEVVESELENFKSEARKTNCVHLATHNLERPRPTRRRASKRDASPNTGVMIPSDKLPQEDAQSEGEQTVRFSCSR